MKHITPITKRSKQYKQTHPIQAKIMVVRDVEREDIEFISRILAPARDIICYTML